MAPEDKFKAIGKACVAAVGACGSPDGHTCRCCKWDGSTHAPWCPVNTLVHITNVCISDDPFHMEVLEKGTQEMKALRNKGESSHGLREEAPARSEGESRQIQDQVVQDGPCLRIVRLHRIRYCGGGRIVRHSLESGQECPLHQAQHQDRQGVVVPGLYAEGEMTVAQQKLYKTTCDLCGRTETGAEKPAGWVRISVEDSMLDRMFHDKDICESCVKSIERRKGR